MARVRGMHGKRLDDAIERVESLVVRVLRGIARTVASLVGGSPSTTALSADDLQVIRRDWSEAVTAEIVPELADAYAESARTLADDFAAAGRPVEPVSLDAPSTTDFLDAATNRLVGVSDTLWDVARQELADGIRAGEGVEELTARLQQAGGFGEARARTIARTEVAAAANAASLAQAMRLDDGTMRKEWLATMDAGNAVCDERTRAAHCSAHEQVQPLGEPFQVGDTWLMYPGQPIGPADEVINCRCSIGWILEDEVVDEPLTAAAEVHTGAMVALRPSVEDAERLAVDGGEPADQLHCTLAYLGTAADIPPEVQRAVIGAIQSLVEDAIRPDYDLPMVADGFAVSMFNPPGSQQQDGKDRDSCVVLGLSGGDLDAVHGMVVDTVREVFDTAGLAMPEQHAPWVAHATLQYTDDPGRVEDLTDRAGPVTFDAIRVVFGGEVTDIPLAAVSPEGAAADDNLAVVPPEGWDVYFAARIDDFFASDENLREYWTHGEGAAKIRWGTDGDFDRCVRHLGKYVRDPEGLCAEYHKQAVGKWPAEKDHSADTTEPAFDATTTECAVEGCTEVNLQPQPGEHFHTRVLEGVSTGLRQFAPNAITWRTPPFAFHEQIKSSAHGGLPETVQTGLVTRAVRDGSDVHFWGRLDLRSTAGLDYARRLAEGWARWSSVGPDESVKDQNIDVEYVLGEAGEDVLVEDPEIDLMTFRDYRVAEITAVSVPALADATVEPTQELIDTLTAMGVIESKLPEGQAPEPQETDMADVTAPETEPQSLAVVVAAGHTITIPDVPPAEWFDEPPADLTFGAMTITDEGRIYGYLAPSGIAHRSFRNRRVEVPMRNVDYSRWMGGEAIVAGGGRVVAGPITMNCGHMPPAASSDPGARMEHYDNTCSVVAQAAIGENTKGVWIAGALLPGVTAEQVSRMLACRLSGDWAPHPEKSGWREFVAALLVPVPGFPMARTAPSTLKIADGALVAAAVPVQLAEDVEELMETDEGAAPFAEGARVRVLDPRDPDVTEGEIVAVHTGPAYALMVAGRDEPVHWYVAEELEPAAAEAAAEVEEMPAPAEVVLAAAEPDLGPALDFVARKVGRDPASRMAILRDRVHTK